MLETYKREGEGDEVGNIKRRKERRKGVRDIARMEGRERGNHRRVTWTLISKRHTVWTKS